jgi:hypothetical protein
VTQSLWTDRQFWLDAGWRSLRTFCQTLAGCLTAWTALVIVPVLQNPTADVDLKMVTGGVKLWALFLFASSVAALVSLLQAIDRGREASKVVAAGQPTAVEPLSAFAPIPAADEVVTVACGDTLR